MNQHGVLYAVMAGEACPGEGRGPAIHDFLGPTKTWIARLRGP
jgi:hypothetical protein